MIVKKRRKDGVVQRYHVGLKSVPTIDEVLRATKPILRAKIKAYNQSPSVKASKLAYNQRKEIKARVMARRKEREKVDFIKRRKEEVLSDLYSPPEMVVLDKYEEEN